MKPSNPKRPLLFFFLLVLIVQGAAASAMGPHVAAQLPQGFVSEASPVQEPAASDCHDSVEVSVDHTPAHESHGPSPVDDHIQSHEADHAHGDCCSADGDCSPGHCSATVALAQVNVPLLPWTAIQSCSSCVPQVRAPVYPLFRPPISA